jgi:hypothetical protein
MATPRKRPEDKVKTGRPSSYLPEYCARVVEMGGQGNSPLQMAAELGVLRETLYDWAKIHPEFSTAFTRAKELSQKWWEDAGKTGVFAEKFNAQVWKFVMSNRFKHDWAERRVQEVSGPDGGPIQTETKALDVSRLSREERDALRRTLLIALGEGEG